jgi:hypothetical protein
MEDLASESMDAEESRGNFECKNVTGRTARMQAAVGAARSGRKKRHLP